MPANLRSQLGECVIHGIMPTMGRQSPRKSRHGEEGNTSACATSEPRAWSRRVVYPEDGSKRCGKPRQRRSHEYHQPTCDQSRGIAPTQGRAQVLGLDPMADGPKLRQQTGVLTETPSLDERLTGRQNLEIYAELYDVPVPSVAQRVDSLLERAELTDRAGEKVAGYSKGMKQRLALARALLHEPQLLFLDEPTGGLDPVASRRVHELITHMSYEEGRTVFMCTHNLAEAQRLCHRVAVLEHGRLVALGTPSELGRQLGGSRRLEMEVHHDDIEAARSILEASFDAQLTREDGTLLRFSSVEHARIPELVAMLVAAGVRLYQVTPQEPSLEDVYFALHGEESELEVEL
jgi:ABC-2 type transport system ATP-binding protein